MKKNLTEAEHKSNYETFCHIHSVQRFLFACSTELNKRALLHDLSKFETPEIEVFATKPHSLKDMEFGSPEYEEGLSLLNEAIEHHYSVNRHHPQFHEDGINGMHLIDLLEMCVDWYSSSKRSKNGGIENSLKIGIERFDISPQLAQILENTMYFIEELKEK
jgi:hypothetical protein